MPDPVAATDASAPELLYEDAEIVVLWQQGRSEHALVTFGDLITLAKGTRFSADLAVRKLGLSCVGFMARRPNWYPAASMRAALPAALARLRPYAERVLYGGSMGGYAAAKFSAALRATSVIAYCPQWSIDRAECGGRNPGWQDHFAPAMRGMGIRPDDVAGQLYVFADGAMRIDDFHATMIQRASPAARRFSVPLVGHHVTTAFAGTATLAQVIAACRAGDGPALAEVSRRARRASPIYARTLLARAGARFPVQVWRHLRGLGPGEINDVQAEQMIGLAAALAARGLADRAADCLTRLQQSTRTPAYQASAAALRSALTDDSVLIGTAHGLVLAYNPRSGTCLQVARASPLLGTRLPAVRMRLQAGTATLFYVRQDGGQAALGVDARGHLAEAAHDARTPFAVSCPAPGRLALRAGPGFLCATPGGAVVCNRPRAGLWEQLCLAG